MTKLRIAVVQGMCRPYRAHFFEELTKLKGMEFTFLLGKAPKYMTHAAFLNPEDLAIFKFDYQFMPTISYQGEIPTEPFHWKRSFKFYPTLLFQILRGKYDVIITESGLYADLIPLLLGCKLTKRPLIIWNGGNMKDNAPKSSDPLINKIVYTIVSFVHKRCDAAIAYGKGSKEFLIFLGVNPNKIFIATNTVDNFFFEEIPRMNRKKVEMLRRQIGLENKKVILYAGSLEPRKKLDILIAAFERIKAKLPETSLLILGDGPDKDRLVKLCSKKKLTKDVKFVGKVDYYKVPLYYALSDVFVLPSQGGITVMEAMASGKPVIVSEECNALYSVPGIVRPKENGFIVKKGDSYAIEKHLYQLLTDESLAVKMGKKSKELARNLFSIDRMIEGFIKAIKYVTRKNPGLVSSKGCIKVSSENSKRY
jgi:glycosyltransferase involved in cell wall biosynthesis